MKISRWMLPGALVALVACGGSGGGGVSIQDLGPRTTAASCAFAVRCGFFPDEASCEGSIMSDLGQMTADVQAGKIEYDGTAASACLSGLSGASCTVVTSTNPAQQACDDAFKGTVAGGQPCYAGAECVSRQCDMSACATGTMCCAGTCSAASASIAAGGSCTATAPESMCVAGTSCRADATGAGSTCQPLVAVGGACADFVDCVVGAECQEDALGHGTCRPSPTEGQACDSNSGLACAALSNTCDAASHTCVPLTAIGGPCSVSAGGCVFYALCDPNTLKCVALGGAGDPCTQDSCLGDLECVNGACALPATSPVCP